MKSPQNPLSLVTAEPDIVRKSRGEAREKSGRKVQGVEGSRAEQARLIAHMLHNAQAQSYRTPRPAEPRTFVFSRKISRVFLIGPRLILAYIKLYPTHYGSSCWATQPSPASYFRHFFAGRFNGQLFCGHSHTDIHSKLFHLQFSRYGRDPGQMVTLPIRYSEGGDYGGEHSATLRENPV